ncbi:MAG: hypothetical protein PHQ70_03775 [Arcobacter sp.]|uniref:hypothetical protein n=1 Tax=Arcobacter sp. TaxID=1872629 RepID=UPI002590136F|nr:hypothetical protein [Arcobacter sp.]MDD3007973.1 hypothetical protein [Arcobacter sp.]
MRTKTKSFFEDLFILLVLGVIIYVAFSFIFGENENEFSENNTSIEKNIENTNFAKQVDDIKEEIEKKLEETIASTQNEPVAIIEQTTTNEDLNKSEIVEEKVEKKPEQEIIKIVENQVEPEVNNEPISTEVEKKEITEKIETKPVVAEIVEKPIEKTEKVEKTEQIDDEKVKVEAFYQTIREKINSNIDKTNLKTGEYVNIRLTILKDGRYEQLTFMDGNKEYFELVKPSIYKAFPVQIETSMKNNFPRYFRMKIEF